MWKLFKRLGDVNLINARDPIAYAAEQLHSVQHESVKGMSVEAIARALLDGKILETNHAMFGTSKAALVRAWHLLAAAEAHS